MQTYIREVAKVIIESRIKEFEISDDGIRPRKVPVENSEFDQLINWTPSCELDGADAPDPMIAPALPFPFTANQLAAFMIHGCGYFVREQFGDWADGPDPLALKELGIAARNAKAALQGAFAAYRAAECVVGAYDKTYSERIQELEELYGLRPDAPAERQSIEQAHADAEAYEAGRRKRLVNLLLAVPQVIEAPAQHAAIPAPVDNIVVPVSSGKKWTPEKLVELKKYREAHTMPETAKHFVITEQRIRQLLPTKKPKAKPFSGLIHRSK
jgi:hypothetical protein